MDSNKKYWKGLEELNRTPEFVEKNKNEFAEPIPIEEVLSGSGLSAKTPRRDFLKALGFGVGAVTLAACQKVPVHKSIPYLIKPEEVTPGVANYYSSTYEGQAILVKTREGRPIKVEGNPNDIFAKGGLSAQAQASVLDLYDVNRLKDPKINGTDAGWDAVDAFVIKELAAVAASGKGIRLVTSTIHSPSTLAVIADFTAKYPTTKHINYDAVSYTGIIQANQNSFGKAVLPHYNFDKADIIVSFGADFLGTWISGEEFTRQYVSNRNNESLEKKKMSRHIQFESGMSLTGTNADNRFPIKPSEEGSAIISLYNAIAGTTLPGTKKALSKTTDTAITLVAKELLAAKGKALVVAGSNDVATQVLVNAINSLLGSYGTTIDLDNPSKQYAGNDAAFVEFVSELNRGDVGAVFFLNANPAYDYFKAADVTAGLKKVRLSVSFSDHAEETANLVTVIAPNHHYLESWGDANAVEGYYTVVQPTINPVYNTRQAEHSLLVWSDNAVKDYYAYVRNNWDKNLFPKVGLSGQKGWESLLQTGMIKTTPVAAGTYSFTRDLNAVAQTILDHSNSLSGGKFELQVYQSQAIGDGKRANNPWLQELPDPVSKVTWDNFAALSIKDIKDLKLNEGDVIKVTANGYSVEVPVLAQPGQATGTISIAVGYGRVNAGPVGDNVGKNAFPFYSFRNGTFQTTAIAEFKTTGVISPLAQTQTHHSYEGRSVIREASFTEYKKNPAAGSGSEGEHKDYDKTTSLWDSHDRPVYDWVMAIDLNACTGCGACVVACNAENNIPVVGKDEVRRRREMHWIRIDRYYSYNDNGNSEEAVTKELEIDKLDNFDRVSVVHQPMLCQHCDHAPCETVCPVLATVHSSEGLNQMAYNRCVGTRYCANNCPYKVRRFNWFNYWNDSRFDNYLNNEHTQLVLNPDVVTRFRGVMEKCSMCVQRIQAGKLKAKIEKRPLKDGEVKMACQQTCSANAIVFGNRNDPNSEVSKALASERTYYVLEELNVKPGIGYQVKVRNLSELEA
ncbi:quinol:cytochrome c oxidoreductase iron-sulfur protein precursor [Mucilaginibacter pineti]|uniref:Quinol:cytochrome c oxidoreductase iron-sulfur protein n=1 Tax=Mucilaginibacter pineti TaxID=1391627 RepID=A0A1G7D3G9_9SPHI|nr:TAT-variant-translocated molybdopterin oxidoreductase [Mucilaginibacter pineti]SDE45570.1 quinol:cytochrome c oxidoreductase iron-sulfur protein precursor [Mucilaginibacter pineti]